MKVCIVGVTGHLGYVLEGLKKYDEIELAAVAPGSEGENTDGFLKKLEVYGIRPKKYCDYERMLDMEKPDIAVTACYFKDHARVSMNALGHGINVFSEKPLATTMEDLESLKKAYDRSNAKLCAMFGLRYTPWFLTAKKSIDDGVIGKVRLMNAQKSYKLGRRGINFKKREIYGGTIPWVGSHAVDWMHWMSGEKFESVFASHSSMFNNGHGDLEVSALCHFTFSNEVFGSANIDYLRPESAVSHGDDRIRIAGTEGVIEVKDERVYLINSAAKGRAELDMVEGPSVFEDFVNMIKGGTQAMNDAESAFIVTEACLKARLSAERREIQYFDKNICNSK